MKTSSHPPIPTDQTRTHCITLGAILTALAMGSANPPSVLGGDLERELLRHAPTVINYLQAKGYRNVAVLKFRVKKGEGPATDKAGTLNLTVAQRLELALLLKNDVKNPLGIIHDASAVAARIKGASHLNADKRQKLFEGHYPLAWGTQEVTADVFVTGVVQVSPDLKKMTVGILAFDRKDSDLQKVDQFTAKVGFDDLQQIGESFLLRGFHPREPPEAEDAAEEAARVKARNEGFPLEARDAPIEFEIWYGQRKIDLEIRDGKARVAEPQVGEKVIFVLRRKADSQDCYGVVLKVNSENTLFQERLKDFQCRKRILEPGDSPVIVRGFRLTDATVQAFRVLSREESRAREMDYGPDVGTITLTVFREKRGGDANSDVPPSEDEDDVEALNRGIFPAKRPANHLALKQQFQGKKKQAEEKIRLRGLLGEGEEIKSGIEEVDFEPDPIPVMTATITYYRP